MVRRRRFFSGWLVVAAVCLIQIPSQGAGNYLFSLVLVPMQRDLGWGRGELSGAYSLGLLVLAAILVPVGILVDRVGARVVLACGCVLGAVCLVGIASIREPWQLYVLWGIGLGITQALTSVQVGSTAIANWFIRRRGTALAWLAVGIGLASPIYVPIASSIVNGVGWRTGLAALAVPFLALGLPMSLLVRRRPEDAGLRPDGDGGSHESIGGAIDGSALRDALRAGALWLLSFSSIFPAIAWGIVNTHQFAFMLGAGFDPRLAATVVAVAGLASLPGRFALNMLGDRFGAKTLLIVVIALQALGICLLLRADTVAWLVAYSVTYGSATGAAFGLRSKLLGDLFGRRAFGAITALHGTLIYVGSAIGPVVGGVLFDRFHDYHLAFALAAAMTALSIAGLAPIRAQAFGATPEADGRPAPAGG